MKSKNTSQRNMGMSATTAVFCLLTAATAMAAYGPNSAYTWGISNDTVLRPQGHVMTGATLTIHNAVFTDTIEPRAVHIHLLDNPDTELSEYTDNNPEDYFGDHGVILATVYPGDLPATPSNITIPLQQHNDAASPFWNMYQQPFTVTFGDATQIQYSSSMLAFVDYSGTGRSVGFGIDADNFNFTGLTLELTTQSLTESTPAQTQVFQLGNMPLNVNPVINWKLTETSGTTAYDSSDVNGLSDAQLVNNPVWAANGDGLSFNGTYCYLEAADSDDLELTRPTTFSMWIRLNAYKPWAKIFIKPHSLYALPWEMYAIDLSSSGDRPRFAVSDGVANGDATMVASPHKLKLNQWHHIVATYDGSNIRIYLDGRWEGTRSVDFKIGTNSMPLSIGGRLGYNTMNGNMSDIRIYHDCLSDEQVETLYSQGRSQPAN